MHARGIRTGCTVVREAKMVRSTGAPCVPSAVAPLNGSWYQAPLGDVSQQRSEATDRYALSLETAATSFNKLGTTPDASAGVLLSSFFVQ